MVLAGSDLVQVKIKIAIKALETISRLGGLIHAVRKGSPIAHTMVLGPHVPVLPLTVSAITREMVHLDVQARSVLKDFRLVHERDRPIVRINHFHLAPKDFQIVRIIRPIGLAHVLDLIVIVVQMQARVLESLILDVLKGDSLAASLPNYFSNSG